MKYRKGDVLIVRVVVTHNDDGLESTLMAHPPGEDWNSRSFKLSNIVGVERLKFDPGEPAIYDGEPCTVSFVNEETNKAWIVAFDNDLVVHVSELSRPSVEVVRAPELETPELV